LPERFTSPEDIAQAYRHAEQKITEQGTELAQLRAQVAQQQQTDAFYAEEEYDPALTASDPLELLRGLAEQAQRGVRQEYVQQTAAQIAQQADDLATLNDTTYIAHRTATHQFLQANPHLIEGVSSPEQLAHTFRTVASGIAQSQAQQAQAAQANSTHMKEMAQSAVGAGGRALTPDSDVEAWDKIKSSGPKSYWQE
jgi:hypothetical protein